MFKDTAVVDTIRQIIIGLVWLSGKFIFNEDE